MAFEYLDLENKLYIPTQVLSSELQANLISLYAYLRQSLTDAHNTIAVLGKEWYDNPVEITTRWYQQSVNKGTELYARAIDELLPKAESTYEDVLASADNFAMRTKDSFNYVIENPEQLTAEAIETMTESLTAAGDISSELAGELQSKTTEIVELLLEQPLQTLEAAYMEMMSSLLNGYFEVVSTILNSL